MVAPKKNARKPAPKPRTPTRELPEAPAAEPEEVLPDLNFYDPDTHVCLRIEDHQLLLQGALGVEERVGAFIEADARKSEGLFAGFQSHASMVGSDLKEEREYSRGLRDSLAQKEAKIAALELEKATMIRASEEAKLERERLATDVRRAELSIQRLQIEGQVKLQERNMELTMFADAARPLLALAGEGMTFMVKDHLMGKALGKGASAAPKPANNVTSQAPTQTQPQGEIRVLPSLDGLDEFDKALWDTYAACRASAVQRAAAGQPTYDVRASLRAIMASTLLKDHGAPPIPPEVISTLGVQIMNDAGQEQVLALLKPLQAAYVVAPQDPAPGPNPPPSTAMVSAQATANAPKNGALN